MKNKLVSVVIPTYNRSKLVTRAVESVCKQSYSNLEIIVVDDNSTDDTQAVIDKLAKKDDRIIYLKNEKNLGGGGSRNVGIKKAKGEIVAFLDSDDLWLENRISMQIESFKEENIVAVFCNYNMIEFETEKVVSDNSKAGKCQTKNIYFGNYLGTTSCLMARRAMLLQIGMFDATLKSCQDWDLYIRLIQSGEIIWGKEILLSQYFHAKRLSSNKENVIQGNSVLIKKMEDYCKKMNFGRYRTQKIISSLYYRLGLLHCAYGDWEEAKVCLKRSVILNLFNYKNIRLGYKLLLQKK